MWAQQLAYTACTAAAQALQAWADAEPAKDQQTARVRSETKRALRKMVAFVDDRESVASPPDREELSGVHPEAGEVYILRGIVADLDELGDDMFSADDPAYAELRPIMERAAAASGGPLRVPSEPAAVALLRRIYQAFPQLHAGCDDDLSGGDAIETLAPLILDAEQILATADPWARMAYDVAPSDRGEVIAHAVRAFSYIARTVEEAGKLAYAKRDPAFQAADWRDIAQACGRYSRQTLAEMGRMVGLFTPETRAEEIAPAE